MPPGRGGRGGGRGGRGGRGGAGGYNPARGTVSIAGIELNWDLSGLEIQRAPAERFPKNPPPQPTPPTPSDLGAVKHTLAIRDTIHEGAFYTILNDGMKDGLKRKANDVAPTEAALFNPFTDNQTYTSKYLKVRRRIPKLDTRPYVTDLFPPELRSILDHSASATNGDAATGEPPAKKRKVLQLSKSNAVSQIERYIKDEEQRTKTMEERGDEDEDVDLEEEEEEDEKPDAVGEEDNWSAVSSDSEESGDDYNAEAYFDNGEDDELDDDDQNDNTY